MPYENEINGHEIIMKNNLKLFILSQLYLSSLTGKHNNNHGNNNSGSGSSGLAYINVFDSNALVLDVKNNIPNNITNGHIHNNNNKEDEDDLYDNDNENDSINDDYKHDNDENDSDDNENGYENGRIGHTKSISINHTYPHPHYISQETPVVKNEWELQQLLATHQSNEEMNGYRRSIESQATYVSHASSNMVTPTPMNVSTTPIRNAPLSAKARSAAKTGLNGISEDSENTHPQEYSDKLTSATLNIMNHKTSMDTRDVDGLVSSAPLIQNQLSNRGSNRSNRGSNNGNDRNNNKTGSGGHTTTISTRKSIKLSTDFFDLLNINASDISFNIDGGLLDAYEGAFFLLRLKIIVDDGSPETTSVCFFDM